MKISFIATLNWSSLYPEKQSLLLSRARCRLTCEKLSIGQVHKKSGGSHLSIGDPAHLTHLVLNSFPCAALPCLPAEAWHGVEHLLCAHKCFDRGILL
jgi:hypothetical protein